MSIPSRRSRRKSAQSCSVRLREPHQFPRYTLPVLDGGIDYGASPPPLVALSISERGPVPLTAQSRCWRFQHSCPGSPASSRVEATMVIGREVDARRAVGLHVVGRAIRAEGHGPFPFG